MRHPDRKCGSPGPSGRALAARLRQEAAEELPRFSATLHERIVRRLPRTRTTEAMSDTQRQPAALGSSWRILGPVAASVLVAAVIAAWIDGPSSRATARSSIMPAAEHLAADSEPGIERVPMFDEIEAGAREGVTVLAATLLEAPEWRTLIDFDPAAFLGADASP